MNFKTLPRRQVAASWLAWASALVVGLAACTSDEPNPTGTTLPADVSQDTLEAVIELVGTQEERWVQLPTSGTDVENFVDRQVLYFGRQTDRGWESATLIQWDFSDIPDTVDYSASNIARVEIDLTMLLLDANRGLTVDLAILELNTSLDALKDQILDNPLSNALGDTIKTVTGQSLATTTAIKLSGGSEPLDPAVQQKVADWLTNRAHNGIAIIESTPSLTNTLVGYASNTFNLTANRFLLTDGDIKADVSPVFVVDFFDPQGEANGVRPPVLIDMSYFTRPAPLEGISLDSHLPARVWLDFGVSGVPRAATINNAELVLSIPPPNLVVTGEDSMTFQPTLIDARVYEAYGTDDLMAPVIEFELVRNALGSIDALDVYFGSEASDRQLRLNIRDYVQRVVNGIFEDDPQGVPGLLVVGTSPDLLLSSANFYGTIATDDSLRPRIEVTFTPPADYVP